MHYVHSEHGSTEVHYGDIGTYDHSGYKLRTAVDTKACQVQDELRSL